jgi:rhodanese-related sulfurtransferase
MIHITVGDLHKKLGALEKDELILDVRSLDEYRSGHVPGSRNIPHDQVASHVDDLRKYKKVYVHCQAGVRAGKATDALEKLGLTNLVCVSGAGMGEWIASGFPVET